MAQPATLGWALRRAALGLLMMFAIVMFGAWILWASIEPEEASASDAPNSVKSTSQRR